MLTGGAELQRLPNLRISNSLARSLRRLGAPQPLVYNRHLQAIISMHMRNHKDGSGIALPGKIKRPRHVACMRCA
jgi:hypothetical protein